MRSSTHQRLVALEAAADRVLTYRWNALDLHYERIVGRDVMEQCETLIRQANRGEMSDEEYIRQYEALFAPYDAALAADEQLQATWTVLGRALSYRELAERMNLRKKA